MSIDVFVTFEWMKHNGLVVNPHMWIGDGWLFCVYCKQNTLHFAMSHPGMSDCFEVCEVCHLHHVKGEFNARNGLEQSNRPKGEG